MIGSIHLEHWRDSQFIGAYDFLNGVTNVGKNALVNAGFNGATPGPNWYMGLIDNDGYTALSVNDTMASHVGWRESIFFDGATRPLWPTVAATSNQVQSTIPSIFLINSSVSIRGVFFCNDSTINGTIGLLWATALLDTPLNLYNYDFLRITYNVKLVNRFLVFNS